MYLEKRTLAGTLLLVTLHTIYVREIRRIAERSF